MVNVPMMEFGGVFIPRELGEKVILLIQQNNKMEAIRVLREEAGLDLKTAKEAVDSYCDSEVENKTAKQFYSRKKGSIKVNKRFVIIIMIISVLLGGIFKEQIIHVIQNELFRTISYKPVIYLYPEEEMYVTVKIDLDGEFTCTYPEYNDGWEVLAKQDGILIDKFTGLEYSYLFWEGASDVKYDMTKGFVVAGKDTAEFLQKTLVKMGLTPKEYNEFIVYWLPQMENNPYNLITFQQELYTEYAKLDINPAPDSVLRVFMVYKPLSEQIEVEAPELDKFQRNGFTVVEWGGTMVN